MRKLVVVDVESDGPCPGLYSMVSFGAVVVEPGLRNTFYGECRPISEKWIPEALAVSGHSREKTLKFPDSFEVMSNFADWLTEFRPIFVSDNVAFDWQFINYYFHLHNLGNPFGFSGRRIGDLYCGLERNMFSKWKHLRKTKHDHNPVNDAKGNAEALLTMATSMGLKGIL